ncbi:proactivator polypeptide-like 1 [Punica granatum]|uniref:Pulmonary surfactant-associated protein B n=1 Tax=Punica granatum TaxID=22663 RepID=A0A6P8DP68_PUNGR|nr:proactivator polypeptide-like 1 [Punica granatum]
MDVRIGFFVLVVLGALGTSSARQLPRNLEALNYPEQGSGNVVRIRNDKVCTLCEEYATMALDYLTANSTKREILALLYMGCSQLPEAFQPECITLVDHYAPLLFKEISSLQPGEICEKVDLCQKVAMISSQIKEDSCDFCQNAVSELMDKLKDPDTQMDIIQLLLKACNSMQNYVKKVKLQCKRMVLEYGPLIIDNAEEFLENTNICTAIRACSASSTVKEVALPTSQEAVVLSDS